jgi:hypothetical protein
VLASEAGPAALALPEASALAVVRIPQHLAPGVIVNGMAVCEWAMQVL